MLRAISNGRPGGALICRRATKSSWNPAHQQRLRGGGSVLLWRHFAGQANDNKNGSGFSIWYPILGGLFITTAGGLKWWHEHVGGSEGLKRSAIFYSYAIPKYIQYRYHAWRKSPDEVWDALNKETSQGALERISQLKGFYIKSGTVHLCNINIFVCHARDDQHRQQTF